MNNCIEGNTDICILITGYGDGGAERMLVNLATGFSNLGYKVDFVVNQPEGPFLNTLPRQVQIFELGAAQFQEKVDWFRGYLRRLQPKVTLTGKLSDDELALAARQAADVATKIFIRPGTNFSQRFDQRRRRFIDNWLTRRRLRAVANQSDGVIAVSKGVAEDISRITHIPIESIHAIENPTVTPEMYSEAESASGHPWLDESTCPVILGVGGLRRAKDFPTLIRAFAIVRSHIECRLIILGEGRQRKFLLKLADRFGVRGDFDLPGFASNVYAHLSKADVFVLSSTREGSPNVLIEAMALGIPVVSTNCPSGPQEITQNGRVGKLVPTEDPKSMAHAILQTISEPPNSTLLKCAVSEYSAERSAQRYLEAFDLVRYR